MIQLNLKIFWTYGKCIEYSASLINNSCQKFCFWLTNDIKKKEIKIIEYYFSWVFLIWWDIDYFIHKNFAKLQSNKYNQEFQNTLI
jgi:hypothetical protein